MGNRNSGRRPKPTALKVLRGNPGQRPLNQSEPQPPAGDVVRPIKLSPGAVVVWDEMAPICVAMGTLTRADGKAFGAFCELQATLEEAWSSKDATFQPFTVRDEDDSEHPRQIVVIDAVLKLERETATALRPFYEKFGLEPVGRARISVPKAKAPESKWAAMGMGSSA